jgi:hypothetical protein
MGSTKARGPGGYPALFYQKHWDMLGDDICEAMMNFLERADIPEGLCDKIIVHVLKISRPERLTNFQPISLCDVLYKITSKVLANRLKPFQSNIIAEEQSAFVLACVAYECVHTI